MAKFIRYERSVTTEHFVAVFLPGDSDWEAVKQAFYVLGVETDDATELRLSTVKTTKAEEGRDAVLGEVFFDKKDG